MSGPYIITTQSPAPNTSEGSFRRDTAKEAVIRATGLMGVGMKDVRIIDAQNRVYGHDQFAALLALAGDT